MTDISQGADPAAEFASLMGRAAEQADVELAETPAPARAPRTRARKSPSLEELAGPPAEPEAPPAAPAPEAPGDRAPDDKRRAPRSHKKAPGPDVTPPYKAGVIATGVNKLYRRAGKIVRAMDADVGEAIIQAARNTADPGEPDDSVGAAWDELAKTNPRIRRFLLKCVAGGAWGQLVMAHAPIAMAIVMKPAILKLIPFSRLIESMAEPDDDTPEGDGGLPGGMTAPDAAAMAQLAQRQVAAMGLKIPPEVAEQMAAAAASMMGGAVPGGQARTQPRRPAGRAQRKRANGSG
jgi:hypothetical protein